MDQATHNKIVSFIWCIADDVLRGLFEATVDGKPAIVEYEHDSDLRDTEQVPLLKEISADILAIEKEAEGLLDGLLKGARS